MKTRRPRINRVLPRAAEAGDTNGGGCEGIDAPRRLGPTLIDFSALHLPTAVSCALADAFWNHVGSRSEHTLRFYWQRVNTFAHFVAETHAVSSLSDMGSVMLVRYIEWLNRQVGQDGTPLKILVVPALPQNAQAREQSIGVLRSKGIDAVIPFRTMLAELVAKTEPNRNYQKSDLLQIIRILKNYDLIKEPQLELFKVRRKKASASAGARAAE